MALPLPWMFGFSHVLCVSFPQKWSLSQSWGLESKLQMWAGRAPPEASLLFSPCPRGVTPLRACVLISYKDTSQIRPGPTRVTSFTVITTFKAPSPNAVSHTLKSRG